MKIKPNVFLYTIAGIIFFIFWMIVVFPYEALQSRVITEIENRIGDNYKLEMEDADLSLFGSVTLENLVLTEILGDQENLLLKTPKFKLGFSPFIFLSDKVDFTFFLKGKKKGDMEGAFKKETDKTEIAVNINDYQVSDLDFLASKANVVLNGVLNGNVDLKLNQGDPKQSKGEIEIALSNLVLDPTKITLDPSDPASAMETPRIKLSGEKGSHITAKVNEGRLEVQSITLRGGDLELDLQGRISLQGASPKDYRLDMDGSFKVSEALDKALPFLFIIEQQRNAQGFYPVKISGRISKPAIRIGKFRVPI